MFELIGQMATAAAAFAAAWWGFERWRRRDEHPRIELEVSANFLGTHHGRELVEIVATVENKGVVPLRYKNFGFKLLGLHSDDSLTRGGATVRGQVVFGSEVARGSFIPDHWEYSFIYPGVKTEYNYITDLPEGMEFVRVQADLEYMRNGESHHAAKALRVPRGLGREAGPPLLRDSREEC